jgi:polar amino acid transport system substrate-binding protein
LRHDEEIRFAFLIEPPFCYRAPEGAVTGCDVEVARHVIRQVGLGAFVPVETAFAELLPGLADGRWDMTTGLFVTAERREVADFSRPIWALPDGLLVGAGNPHGVSGYSSIARAVALRLGVVRDQVQHSTALRLGVPEDRIQAFETYAEAAAAVAAGTIDAYASVAMAHRGYLERQSACRLAVVEVPTSETVAKQGAYAFAKDRSPLRAAVDDALSRFLGSVDHRALMARFGFPPEEVDRVASIAAT